MYYLEIGACITGLVCENTVFRLADNNPQTAEVFSGS